jgi:hypothetical protein
MPAGRRSTKPASRSHGELVAGPSVIEAEATGAAEGCLALGDAGTRLPELPYPVGDVPDAGVYGWSAMRNERGEARAFRRGHSGRVGAIWYREGAVLKSKSGAAAEPRSLCLLLGSPCRIGAFPSMCAAGLLIGVRRRPHRPPERVHFLTLSGLTSLVHSFQRPHDHSVPGSFGSLRSGFACEVGLPVRSAGPRPGAPVPLKEDVRGD